MEPLVHTHEMLVTGPDATFCEARVRRFFDRTELVRYDTLRIQEEKILRGDDPGFPDRVEQGIAANRRVIGELLAELEREGVRDLDDVRMMDQGSCSKILHTVVHLLDGFFGIDSLFYNLEDDSHWVSDSLRQRLQAEPESFWLFAVEGGFQSGDAVLPGRLRPFERRDD